MHNRHIVNLDLLFAASVKWCCTRTLQNHKTTTLASLLTNGLKGATMMKAMSFYEWCSCFSW